MPLPIKLAIVFIGVPLLELTILLRIGSLLGFWPTVGIVLLTGVLGAFLARLEGRRVLAQLHRDLAMGRMPVAEIIDGLLILFAGILLVLPGLLTDLFGFALLVPWTRRALRFSVGRRIRRMTETRRFSVITFLD